MSKLERIMSSAEAYQRDWLKKILTEGASSQYGVKHGLSSIHSYDDFKNSFPIINYEDIASDVDKMMRGEVDILWPGKIEWFAKSSGTTDQRSKFIPVSKANLQEGHIVSAWDTMTFLYDKIPDALMFAEKSLLVGGALETFADNPDTRYGDISAILINSMPAVGRPFYTPDFETALIPDWDEKIEKIAQISSKANVVMIGGVPTWNIVLFRRILEITGKSNLKEVWPNLQAYVHGGVSFLPYKEIFKELIPDDDFVYQEIYNASEGFIAIQDTIENKGMALLLNNAMFFEFIPEAEWHKESPLAIPIWEVEKKENYAIVITNNSGLWRYVPGDTVEFTSTSPYRIKITGRIKHFINAFGEEVIVSNTDKALALTCEQFNCHAAEYTVAPIYFSEKGKGSHEWLIEFDRAPIDWENFKISLDGNLRKINSDYDAKRYKDMALQPPKIQRLKSGDFESWIRANRTMGAQVKVPRLSNDRILIDHILEFLKLNND